MVRMLSTRLVLLALITSTFFAVPLAAEGPSPLDVAAHFLSLSEQQVAHLVTVRQAVQEAVAPLVQEVAARRTLLGELLDGDEPNPAEIGVLLLSIRAFEQQIVAVHQEGAAQIRAMLDADQLERLEAAATARPLCQVIPALTVLHLL